jgi:hypothetical protein
MDKSSVLKKLIIDYDNIVKSIVYYNFFTNGLLFSNITKINIDEICLGTYENICNSSMFSYDVNNFINKVNKYLIDVINIYSENKEEVLLKLNEIKKKYDRDNLRFYNGFCFLAEGVKLLERTDNFLYKFLLKISFIELENDGFLFVQKILILMRELFILHDKRLKCTRKLLY